MVGEKRTFDELIDVVRDDIDVTMDLVHDIILRIQTVKDPKDFHLLDSLRREMENILHR